MWLGSSVAVALAQYGSYSSDSTPSLETSICRGSGPRKMAKRQKKKKKNGSTSKEAPTPEDMSITARGAHQNSGDRRGQEGAFRGHWLPGENQVPVALLEGGAGPWGRREETAQHGMCASPPGPPSGPTSPCALKCTLPRSGSRSQGRGRWGEWGVQWGQPRGRAVEGEG